MGYDIRRQAGLEGIQASERSKALVGYDIYVASNSLFSLLMHRLFCTTGTCPNLGKLHRAHSSLLTFSSFFSFFTFFDLECI